MTAMAAPVVTKAGRDAQAVGVVTIAGPLVRLTEERMAALAPALLESARAIAAASGASSMLRRRAA